MPIFEFKCQECGETSEILTTVSKTELECKACGSKEMTKLFSVPSSLSGAKASMPEFSPGCCGTSPDQAGCAGPGSCCGRQMEMP